MPVHPEIAKLLATLPAADHDTRPDPVAKRAVDLEYLPPLEARAAVVSVDDVTVATAAGEVPVRIYTPVEATSFGLLVYLHGGAFFSGSLDTHDHVARALSKESGYKVVSVGYQLAPEAAFPTALNECYGVVRWAAEHGDALQWDGEHLAVAGDSSGANFAAAVTAMAHDDGFDRITRQVLFYPSLDLDFDTDRYPSLAENAEGYGLETAGLVPWNSFYIESGADPADPLVSPIKREDLGGLPPALIITAEYDPLRDEGELYGRRLGDAGVAASVSRYDGANHGFVQNFFWIPAYAAAIVEAGEFLKGSAQR